MSTANRTAPAQEAVFAPGQRVEIRDAEWVIKHPDRTSSGHYSLLVKGVSPLVQGTERRFLTEIETDIRPLHPEDTKLVADVSPKFADTRLYLESLLRQSPPTGSDLWIGHDAAIDVMNYQLDPALEALKQIRHRILLADAVGLGKTVEVGILLSELIRRGKGKRILVVTTKAMMTQFQKELWFRFTIPLIRLDRDGIDRIQNELPADANPFHYFDKTIISVDTLKNTKAFGPHLEKSYWDIIVIDEAHNVAVRGSRSKRAKLAELLATRSDAMILASATPHDGRADSFASLINMLDPTAIANPKSYGPDDITSLSTEDGKPTKLFIRRFKAQVQEQIGGAAKDRVTSRFAAPASAPEEAVCDMLAGISFESFDKGASRSTGHLLFRTVLEKAFFSSPAACGKTIEQRLAKLSLKSDIAADNDRAVLQKLAAIVAAVTPDQFTKYQTLLRLLRPGGKLKWDPKRPDDRLVIFTERVETLKFLHERLTEDLKLKPNQVAVMHGSETDERKLQDTVEQFCREKSPVRVLIATDIASEGINLHFYAHRLIHFDIPWSLMVFQQRNGRVDRYGQSQQPHICYLITEPQNPKVRGDIRILELLTRKDEQAQTNINDPSAFLGVFDEKAEEIETAKAIEIGLTEAAFEKQMEKTAAAVDWMALLGGADPVPTGHSASSRKHELPSLFGSSLDYFREGLGAAGGYDYTPDPERRMVSLTLPKDLERMLRRTLPRKSIPDDRRLHLTTNRQLVKEAIVAARADDEKPWPATQLLWDLHPAMEWLNYKLLARFGRHQAPVIPLIGALPQAEVTFLMQGEIPNRKGQAVVHGWFAVRFDAGKFAGIDDLGVFLKRTGFGAKQFPNPGYGADPSKPSALLPEAVIQARQWMAHRRDKINRKLEPRLAEAKARLEQLRAAKEHQLELDFPPEKTAGRLLREKQRRARRIADIFRDHNAYVRDTLTTEATPHLRVAAVFTGE